MRVLVVRSSARMAGVERVILELIRHWRHQGVDVGLVAFYRRPPDGPAEHPLVQLARAHGLSAWTILDRGPWDMGVWRQFRNILQAVQPDVVHSHDYKSNWVVATFIPPNRHLVTVHGYTDADHRQRLYRWIDRWVLRRVAWVVVPSQALARELQERGYRSKDMTVIPYGLSETFFNGSGEQDTPLPARDARVITFVGRCSPEKGGDVLLHAVAKLHHTRDVHLWMVGDGPHRGRWMALARRLGVSDRVRFWGWQPSPVFYLRRSGMVVVPSRRESFGLSALEAQWVKTPVIASRVGGLVEVVSPWGKLVRPGDVDALAAAIESWLLDPAQAREAGERSGEWVQARFSLDAMVEGYIALLHRCFGTRPAGLDF